LPAACLVGKTSHSDVATAIGERRKRQAFLSDGNDGCGFDDRRLGLVGDQLAQERNQHDELS
jgi:hypothetical protein